LILRIPAQAATCSLEAKAENSMRAETLNLVEEIKQSVRLLRRHL
jgi:hypothetical protein